MLRLGPGWHGHRGFSGWAGWVAAAIALSLPAGLAATAEPRRSDQNPDWPCRQILVPRLSAAAVWSGPPIERMNWANDRAVAGMVTKLAARRTALSDAEHLIDGFAQDQGPEKTEKLTALFAGLFETLNDERTQVIEGLLRFGAKQKELAAKIRAEKAAAQEKPPQPPHDSGKAVGAPVQELDWDLRLFDERQRSLSFVCESPMLIEQRLFALARAIERNLD